MLMQFSLGVLTDQEFQAIKKCLFNPAADFDANFDLEFILIARKLMTACGDDVERMVASFSRGRVHELAVKFTEFYFSFVNPDPADEGATWRVSKESITGKNAKGELETETKIFLNRTKIDGITTDMCRWELKLGSPSDLLLLLNACKDIPKEESSTVIADITQMMAEANVHEDNYPKVLTQLRAAFNTGKTAIDISVVRANFPANKDKIADSFHSIIKSGLEKLFTFVTSKKYLSNDALLAELNPRKIESPVTTPAVRMPAQTPA